MHPIPLRHSQHRSPAFTLIATLLVLLASAVGHAQTLSETWTGANGAAWPSQWTVTPGSHQIVSIQDNGGNFQQSAAAYTINTGTALINSHVFANVNQAVDLKIHYTTYIGAGLLARRSGDGSSYYLASLELPNQPNTDYWKIQIKKSLNGVVTTLAGPVTVNASSMIFSRLAFDVQTSGASAVLTLTYTDYDGAVTTLNAADSTSVLAAGQIGLSATTQSASTRFVRFDNYQATGTPVSGQLAFGGKALRTIYHKALSSPATADEQRIQAVANQLKSKLNAMIGKTDGQPGAFTVATLQPTDSTLAGITIGKGTDFTSAGWGYNGSHFAPGDTTRRDEYSMAVHGSGIRLGGATVQAVEFGIWDLLYRLGYRQFFPTSTWEFIPNSPDVGINVTINNHKPDYAQRTMSHGFGTWPDLTPLWTAWKNRNRIADAMVFTTHAYAPIICRNLAAFQAHPEYMALVNGSRVPYDASNAKFCLGNTGLRNLIVSDALNQFQNNPSLPSYSVEPSDGLGWCEDALCAQLGSVSNQQVTLANQVAAAVDAQYPGQKYIGTYAYGAHSPPPTINVHPRVVASVATVFMQGGYTPEQLLTGWGAKGAKLGSREYYSVTMWDRDRPGAAMAANSEYLSRTIPDFHTAGSRYMSVEQGDNWGPCGLGYYLAARYLWDTDEASSASAAALRDDFLNKCFGTGTARTKMAEFYTLIDGANKPLMSEDLIGRMYEKCGTALTSTSDAKIRRRIYDLALYTRYVELFFNYSTASGAARQTAFEALMRYTYRIRSTLMVHSYALWRDLDVRDAAVTLPPDPNTTNDTPGWAENPHPWKSEQAYTDAEIDDFIENGIVNNPLLTWTPVSFSENLVPATPLGLTSGPAGSWTYLRYKNSIHMWAPSTPTTFNLNVKGGYIYTNVGNVTLTLTAANNPVVGETVASASAQPSRTTTAVSMSSQFQGLHTIEIQDNAGGSSVWPTTTGIPFTFGLGIENCTQFQSRWTLYFYVPKGTTKVGGYSWGGAADGTDKLLDSTGATRLTFTAAPGFFHADVPAGQDGKLWKFQMANGQRALMTVPPYVARSAAELLLPHEVVDADKP